MRKRFSVLALCAVVALPVVASAAESGEQGKVSEAPAAVQRMTRLQIEAVLREIGPQIEVMRTSGLYAPLLPVEPYAGVDVQRDLHYGPHERHVLDVFNATGAGAGTRTPAPVVVFVHGGGFRAGAKHMPGAPFYDNIGVWAAKHGFVGVTINYRLAPEFQYPSGAEDVARVVGWLKTNAARYGGDPQRIFLWGHSAGATHVADYIARTPDAPVAGAILTSGIYHVESGGKVSPWKDYYGEDASKYREKSSVAGLTKSPVPLLVVSAELDPPDFAADSKLLLEDFARTGKKVQTLHLAGHSHISETFAVGTDDESLSGPVRAFVTRTSKR